MQNMVARMVTGGRRCDRITPILKDLLAARQSTSGLQDRLDGLKVYSRCYYCLPERPVHTCHGHVRSREVALRIKSNLTGSARPDRSRGPAKFRRQRTDHMKQVCCLHYEYQSCHGTLSYVH